MLAVVGGALAWLRADIAKLDDRQRATDAKVDALTQAVRASALTRDPLATTPESGASPTMTERQPTPAG